MDPSTVVNLLVPGFVALLILSRGLRVDGRYVAGWATSSGIDLTDERRPAVRRYLTWSRRSRTIGGVVGFLAPIVVSAITGVPGDPGGLSFALMIAGYLLGSLLAEIVINRPRTEGGVALLVPRRLTDYLPHRVLTMQRALAIMAGSAVVVYGIVLPHARLPKIPSLWQVAIAGGVGIVVAVSIELLQRRIVARRQPVATTDDVELDDAMRSSSLHVLAAVAVSLLVYIAGGLVALTVASSMTEEVFNVVGLPLVVVLFVSSLACWAHLSRPNGFTVGRASRAGRHAEVSG
jgi:hypothetical protein